MPGKFPVGFTQSPEAARYEYPDFDGYCVPVASFISNFSRMTGTSWEGQSRGVGMESGIGGIFFILIGIPGLILALAGGVIGLTSRRFRARGQPELDPAWRKMMITGLVLALTTGAFMALSALVISSSP